jgi:VCBS repeat protein
MRIPLARFGLPLVAASVLASQAMAVNLVTNPSFTGNTSGWTVSSDVTYDAADDATSVLGSGSARSAFVASGASTELALYECIAIAPGTYTLGGKVLIPNGQLVSGAGQITVSFFSGGNCSTGFLTFDSVSSPTTGSFQTISKTVTAPAGTTNAWVTGQNQANGTGTHTVIWDDFVFDNRAAVRTDFNGDKRSDILYRNSSTGQVYRFLMNGLGITDEALAYTEPNVAWQIVADADFNGDGYTDLLYRNSATGQVFMLLFNSLGMPSGGGVIYSEPNLDWKIINTPDIDGDGKADILWWNSTTGQVYVMLMNGLSIGPSAVVYTEPNTQWKIVAVGDFAGSNKRNQLLWRNSGTGQIYLQTVTYSGTFSQTGAMIYQEANLAWKIVGAGDFNGNGRDDILWRNDSTGQLFMQLMNGTAIVGGGVIYTEADLAWKVVALGDYNGDGRADILYRNDSTGQ